MPQMTAIHRWFLAVLPASAVFAVDQVTKVIITEFVMQPPREIPVTGVFNLVLSFNQGLSFGVLSDQLGERAIVLGLGQLCIAAFILAVALHAKTRTDVLALAFMAGGAAGNAMDRLHRGAVVDFLDFHVAGNHWPAFNGADIAIVMGGAFFAFSALRPTFTKHDRIPREHGQ